MIWTRKASWEGDIWAKIWRKWDRDVYRVWGGWGVAACVGSIPDQLYRKCKAPGRSVCLRNSSKKTSRVTVEWGRAGPVWDESKVACLWVFWFWVFALVCFFFFFLVCGLIWGRQSYKGTLEELSPATGLTSACSWLNVGKLTVCVCVCVCVWRIWGYFICKCSKTFFKIITSH